MSQNSLIKKPVEKFSFFEMFLLVLIFSQGVFYIFMWSQLLSNPLLKTMDFISLYGTGRLIREGNYQLIYNYDAEADVQRQVVGDKDYSPLIFNHPPHVTPLLGLIANRNYVLAYIYWSILRLLVLLLCTEMIRRSFLQLGWKARDAILGALGYVVFFPVFISLLGGQDTIFTLTGLLIWMFALLRMQDVKAGMGLAFATLTPTVAGAVALPLLVSRRKAGVWFFLGVSILAVYGFLLVGKDGSLEFLNLLKTSSEGVYYGINWEAMFNFLGLLLRAFPLLGLDLVKLIAWGGAFLSLMFMCILWWKDRDKLNFFHIGLSVLLGTFMSPHLHLHGLSFLIIPLLSISIALYSKHRNLSIFLTPLISFSLFVTEFVFPALRYGVSYIVFAFLAVGLFILYRSQS